MKSRIIRYVWTALVLFATARPLSAGVIYQNFEPDNGAPLAVWGTGGAYVVTADRHEGVHLGVQSLKVSSGLYWGGFGVLSQTMTGDIDLKQATNDRLTFWTLSFPQRACYVYGCEQGSESTVGVIFYDHGNYANNGFEVWTTQTARYDQWSKLKILFSQLPSGLDLRHIARLEFKTYKPGTYYFDDIHAAREDHVYQSFEKEERFGSTDAEYGWKWHANDTAAISVAGEPVFEGAHSWKLVSTAKWGGTGIQSQEKVLESSGTTFDQTFWHVDLDPDNNDRLSFWVYGLPDNAMDNNVNVQFYDNGAHFTDATKVEIWGRKAATAGRWTRLTVLFSDLRKAAADLNLSDLNKIQFQFYWPGTYYIDDIRATGPPPAIEEAALAQGLARWAPIPGAANYRFQESVDGPDGGWSPVYAGTQTAVAFPRLARRWLRVRWEEAFVDRNSLPYASPWSEVVELVPPSVVLKYATLKTGWLDWASVPSAGLYELESAPAKFGPWTGVYRGPMPSAELQARQGLWYRLRGVREVDGLVADLSPWSRPQLYDPGKNYVRSAGTAFKDADGAGDTLAFSGVNLGGGLVIEPWMTGLGTGGLPDDWSVREKAIARFGGARAETLLRGYEAAYVGAFDFDRLADRGVTLVRLPFWYRNLQDDSGNWIRDAQGAIDFSPLDRVVDGLADRGIFTLLDLHGAPGLQSDSDTTGRKGFNKLFAADGEVYRARTVDLWTELARHYQDNRWVLGYDLLNEPIGAAPSTTTLAGFYDRLYKAIRTVDAKHLVVMEGIWFADPNDPQPNPLLKRQILDWDTLPPPQAYGWTNVAYQFHFYHWNDVDAAGNAVKADEDFASHKAFMDQKLAQAAVKQPQYNVPLLIGEFYGFSLKSIWDYYLQSFNSRGWSWTTWSYKYHDSPSTWGLLTHAGYDESDPAFSTDTYAVLTRKLAKYRTADYHLPTVTLEEMLHASALALESLPAGPQPYITGLNRLFVPSVQDFFIQGRNFGASQGSSTADYAGSPLPIVGWTDTAVHSYARDSEPSGSGLVTVTTSQGASNGVDIIVQHPLPNAGMFVNGDGTFSYAGHNLGDTPGHVQFYPAPCNDYPPGSRPCNNADAGITYWSSTLVKGAVPPDALETGDRFNIGGTNGGELYPTMIRTNHPPVLEPVGDKTLTVGDHLNFSLVATDADQDPLLYSATGVPAGGSFIANTFDWTPQANQVGTYVVAFQVSDGQNSVSASMTITVKPLSVVDLLLTVLSSATSAVAPGATLSASATVRNQGTVAAGPFTIRYHLSVDAAYGGADDVAFSAASAVSSLKASANRTVTPTLTVSSSAALGRYYLCARADDAGVVAESDETNNTRCADSTILVDRPDLVMTAVSAPTAGETGASLLVADTVQNQGPVAVASFRVGLYASTDSVISTADRLLGSRLVGALAATAASSGTTIVTVPATLAPGAYYLGAIADYLKVRVEKNEANNALAGARITLSPGADLVMTAVSGSTVAARGSAMAINSTGANQGTGSSGNFYVGIYLSADPLITSTDRRLGRRLVTGLAPGATIAAASSFTVPATLAPGSYYVGAIADDTLIVPEKDETNNARAGNRVLIQ